MRELQEKFINTYNTLNLLLSPVTPVFRIIILCFYINARVRVILYVIGSIMVGTYINIFKYLTDINIILTF